MDKYLRTAKEIARHLMTRIGSNPALDALRRVRGLDSDYSASTSRAERFAQIYSTATWARWGPEAPDSGTGSSLQATAIVRRELPALLARIECQILLDIGCGDFTWMQMIHLPQRYVGVDIVPELIARNSRMHDAERREFLRLDAVTDELPDADVVLCREVLFHLSFDDALSIIHQVKKKPVRYFIATTDRETLFNADIRSGDFRILNLNKAPFRFPEPDFAIFDDGNMPGRTLAAWQVARLP